MNFSDLVGKTLTKVDVGDDEIIFTTTEGKKYLMYHDQDCCEQVYIEDVCGDWKDLIGNPITLAEESSNNDNPKTEDPYDSHTWTFYKLATIKGYVDIRWYGESNGYYSESVNFKEVK